MGVTAGFFELTPRNWRARLAISVDVMRELSRYSDAEEMYQVFARRMSQLYPTSRQVSLSRQGLSHPTFRVTRFNHWKDVADPHKEPHRLPTFSGGLFADLLYHDEPQVIDDLLLRDGDPAEEYLHGQRSLLAIPLFDQGIAANMVVVTREEPAAFPREQVPELVWMSNLFGRALQTQILSERLRKAYDSADYELRVVGQLQQELLPAATPKVTGLEVAVHYQTANRAGGDYYDFFPLPNGRLGVLVADVSGHGTPAAVLMAITHSLAHSYQEPPLQPGRFLGHLNQHLAKKYTGESGNFVTAFYGVIDPLRGTLTFANAGHVPFRVGRIDTGWRTIANHMGLPLGVNSHESNYPEQTIPFRIGDQVALFTDGIPDATDAFGDCFGFDQLDQTFGTVSHSAEEVVQRVVERLREFTGASRISDDCTLVIVRRTA